MKLKPVERIPLSQVVLDQLLEQIRNGSIRSGDHLPGEYELMRRLQVGRSSVREALRGLITLGLVETKPGRGAIVVGQAGIPTASLAKKSSILHLQKWAVLDLLEVRECLEGQAAWLAATRALPADVVKMREAALKVEKCITQGQTYFRPNVEFHMAVAGAAHNSALTESLRCLLGEVRDFRERLMREITGITSRDLGEHRAILQAIESHNPAGARRSMVRHIRKFAALVQEFTGQPVRGAAVSHPGRNR